MLEPWGQRPPCKTLQIVELMHVLKRPTREQNAHAHCLPEAKFPDFMSVQECGSA